jgi:hypothetical protein
MSETDEVAWINSLGFNVTLTDLRNSYTKFVYQPVDPTTTNVLWGTESDNLRNYYRLYKRTGYAPFMQQAQSWWNFMVNTYSNWQAGGNNVIEPEHVYLMGLVDWYVDHQDQPTLDAINRIIDFIEQKIKGNPFTETRVTARCLMGLTYYMEKIGIRAADVMPKIQEFLAGLSGAKVVNGFTTMYFYQGDGMSVTGLPAGQDLRILFPQNANYYAPGATTPMVYNTNSYTIKHFNGVGLYQDMMLTHALNVAARVLNQPALAQQSLTIDKAWLSYVGYPFYDPQGANYNLIVPYYLVPSTPQTSMFLAPGGNSTPLYVTQYAAFCPDPAVRKTLQQQALLRQYAQYSKIQASELGKLPKYFPWQTWEQGYFLTQK